MATVKLGYSSWKNVSFRGKIDTRIEREDWDDMSEEEKDRIINDNLYELVEIYEVPD